MRTLGLIGGMSWESTQGYYRLINEGVKQRLGGLHSARLVLYSVDFAEIEALQAQGEWVRAGMLLADAARSLKAAGAEGLVICTNTMHKVASAIEAVGLPLIHIADATATVILGQGLRRIGLLGTRFTMEQKFYVSRLDRYGLQVLTPDEAGREQVHRIGAVEDGHFQFFHVPCRCKEFHFSHSMSFRDTERPSPFSSMVVS